MGLTFDQARFAQRAFVNGRTILETLEIVPIMTRTATSHQTRLRELVAR